MEEIYTDETGTGTAAALTQGINEFLVGGAFTGFVYLKIQDPNGDYRTLVKTDKPLVDCLFYVADATRNYRIDGERIVGEAVAYAGSASGV